MGILEWCDALADRVRLFGEFVAWGLQNPLGRSVVFLGRRGFSFLLVILLLLLRRRIVVARTRTMTVRLVVLFRAV
jgi:hypothetical protein